MNGRDRKMRVRNAVVHFEGRAPDWRVPCGNNSYTLDLTDNIERVTCRNCIQVLLMRPTE